MESTHNCINSKNLNREISHVVIKMKWILLIWILHTRNVIQKYRFLIKRLHYVPVYYLLTSDHSSLECKLITDNFYLC